MPRKARMRGFRDLVSFQTGFITMRVQVSARCLAQFLGVISPMRRSEAVITAVETRPVT